MLPSQPHHVEFEPPDEIKDAIKCFWYDVRDYGPEESGLEVVPDGYAEIIFYVGSGCSMFIDGSLQRLPSPFIIGLLDQPVTFFAKGRMEIVGIRCFPWTVFDLLGLPSGKDGVRVFEHPVGQLQPALEKLIGKGKTEGAIEVVKQYFLDARSNVAINSMLSKAGIAMRKAKGTLPVSGVAAAAHATVRTLERNFKQSSGHTVKDVSALMRFEQVRNRLWMEPDVNLAALAVELGYSDQSHLSREFKKFSGSTPGSFSRKAGKERRGIL